MTRSYNYTNGNKNTNKNNSNSASSSRIQSVSSDTVFDNTDMDVENPVQTSKKSGRNLSSSDVPPLNKIDQKQDKIIR